jgi:hypothetical protein
MQYEIDDELAFLIDRHAPRIKPFENITLQEGLRRILNRYLPPAGTPTGVVPPTGLDMPELARQVSIEQGMSLARSIVKKAPTPSAIEWAKSVPELAKFKHFTTWKTITDHFDIDTLGDSARRKLSVYVRQHHPEWPPVPDVEG